jgi:hypothetical protein
MSLLWVGIIALALSMSASAGAAAQTLRSSDVPTQDTAPPRMDHCDAAPLPDALLDQSITFVDQHSTRGNSADHVNPLIFHHPAPAYLLLTGVRRPTFDRPALQLLYCTWLS